jgi:hypothetical protein
MSDAAATPNMSAASENAAILSDMRAQAKAAILADDSIVVETTESPESRGDAQQSPPPITEGADPAAPEKKVNGKAEAPAEAKPAEPVVAPSGLAELEKLAAEKRRERMQREQQAEHDRRFRDFDREREEVERRRTALEQRERELLSDPLDYAERHKGWDRSQAAERLVAKQLRPAEEVLRERLEATEARLAKFETESKAEKEARERRERESQERAHWEHTYNSWETLSSNIERFPHMAKLPSPIRRQYGDHVADLLNAAGRQWTQEDVATLVEQDLASRYGKSEAAANGSSAGESKKDGSPRGGEKPPPSTLTNDLASQSAGSTRSLLDPEVRRQNALREAERLGLK